MCEERQGEARDELSNRCNSISGNNCGGFCHLSFDDNNKKYVSVIGNHIPNMFHLCFLVLIRSLSQA